MDKPNHCHVCKLDQSFWTCTKPACKKSYCADCLFKKCPRVAAHLSSTLPPSQCDCCFKLCPVCNEDDAMFAFHICQQFRELLIKAMETAKTYARVRCEEISLRRKRDALQRERQVQIVLGDIVPSEWPKEVSVARGKSLPQFKFYGIVSQSFKADEAKEFRHFPDVGDVPDKAWVEKELKSLYELGERRQRNELTYEEDLVFGEVLNTVLENGGKERVSLLIRVCSWMLQNSEEALSRWQSDYHPIFKPENDSVLSNTLLFCHCRECWHYCCSTHHEPLQVHEPPPSTPTPVPRLVDEPCSDQCSKLPQRTNDRSTATTWSERERDTARRLAKQFGEDACLIGRLLLKPCVQVHALLQQLQAPAVGGGGAAAAATVAAVTERVRQARRRVAHGRLFHAAEVEKHPSYSPCKHEGPCSKENDCRCVEKGGYCERWCSCSLECSNRFPGCQDFLTSLLARSCISDYCLCWQSYRECDPSLCLRCDAALVNVPQAQRACCNVSMQNGYHKVCFIGESQLHGNGLFLGEPALRNDFVFEYTGELLVQAEGERRGTYYDKMHHSFLFNLTEDYVIDATMKGNRTRFANHSKKPNLYTRTIWSNSYWRIGFFADRAIAAGEELTLDYHYKEEFAKLVSIPDPHAKKHSKK